MIPVPRLSWLPVTVVLAATISITSLGARVADAAAAAALQAGWFLAGSFPADYTTHTDTEHAHGGKESALLAASAASPRGFGTLMQDFAPKEFLGKRVRLSAWVKSEGVSDWAGVWMRVDGRAGGSLAFDNMQSRPIKGTTDWTHYDVVLDVPAEAVNLAFGILLAGAGKTWTDDVSFAVVDASVPTTEARRTPERAAPENLDFEE